MGRQQVKLPASSQQIRPELGGQHQSIRHGRKWRDGPV